MDHKPEHVHKHNPPGSSDYLRQFFIVTLLLIPLVLLAPPVLNLLNQSDFTLRPYLQFLISTAIFYQSFVFFRHASHEIKSRQLGMMTLVSLAVGAGYIFSAASTFIPALEGQEFYLEISTLIWILLFGHYLEARSSAMAGSALDEVAKLLPDTVHLVQKGKVTDLDVSLLTKGALVLVKPGERIPSDGVIVDGQAAIDESLITGESVPVHRQIGNEVTSGSIVTDSAITIRVTRFGSDSTVGRIRQLIDIASQTKPQTQLLADKAASLLTVVALVTAVLSLIFWLLIFGQSLVFALTLSITVLVIACPHALGLAIPTVTTVASSLAARNGLFIKDMGKTETIKDIDYIVFDKTGTLTTGTFVVNKIIPLDSLSSDQILRYAASLNQNSNHPIAKSIVSKARAKKLKLIKTTDFTEIPGRGVRAIINGKHYYLGGETLIRQLKPKSQITKKSLPSGTLVYLFTDQSILGVISLSDQIKPESFRAVKQLQRSGFKVAMITGDSNQSAKFVASEIGIQKYFAQVLPEDKYKHIRNLQDEGHKVLMVGDGINDAPAITQSDVGVAIGAGTDVSVEAGDVVLVNNNPLDVLRLIKLSQKTYQKMRQNLWWALGYNIIAIPSAAGVFLPLGFVITPGIAALVMSLSSVIVVINSLTLRKTDLNI